MTDISQQLKENKEHYRRKIEEVRCDPDLSDSAKKRLISDAFSEARAEDTALRERRMSDLKERVRRAEREVFSPPQMKNADPAMVALSYRDALDRASGVTDGRRLSQLLERAVITGDALLARAVAWRANELQNKAVVNEYLKTDGTAAKRWQEWSEAYAELERVQSYGQSLAFGDMPLEEPTEVRQSPDWGARGSLSEVLASATSGGDKE